MYAHKSYRCVNNNHIEYDSGCMLVYRDILVMNRVQASKWPKWSSPACLYVIVRDFYREFETAFAHLNQRRVEIRNIWNLIVYIV